MTFLGKSFARGLLLACTSLIVFSAAASAADYSQNFDSLASSGWTVADLSEEGNPYTWAQSSGATSDWAAYSGAADSFIVGAPNDDSSDWLISPSFSTLSNGDVVSFQMRAGNIWWNVLDALELRLAVGPSCSPGATSSSVGDFTKRLLRLNPGKFEGPYSYFSWQNHKATPIWSKQSVAIAGLPEGEHTGCLAIRRGAPDGWVGVTQLGIDDFSIEDNEAAPGDVEFLGDLWPWRVSRYDEVVVRGRADAGSTVSLYLNADCSGDPEESVSSDAFEWTGVRLQLPMNAVTTISGSSTDGSGGIGACKTYEDFRTDNIAPTTIDDVDEDSVDYPAPVELAAEDSGSGVAKTYFVIGSTLAQPTTSSPVYDPASPPTLMPGQWVTYFSVDNAGNAEETKTSKVAPLPPTPPAPPVTPATTEPTGRVTQSAKPIGIVNPARSALRSKRGRVVITLRCAGGSDATACSGTVALTAALGSTSGKPKRITAGSVAYSIPAGTAKSVTVTLTASARKYLAHAGARAPWVQVVTTPAGSAKQTSFRRKLR